MERKQTLRVTFWGVRGSVPSPLRGEGVEGKIATALARTRAHPLPTDAGDEEIRAWMQAHLAFEERSTFGGNTTCVEIRAGDELIICDMGTGIRELGNALLPETFRKGGIAGTILQSHVHWDHIQGYPFFPHVHLPRSRVNNAFTLYGGHASSTSFEAVLRGQMDEPVFPVNHLEIERTGLRVAFNEVWDQWSTIIETLDGPVVIRCRKLNHPQVTFGYRVDFNGQSVAFCTDHEPYAGGIHQPLLDLASGVDLFITDCQYAHEVYTGKKGGVQRMGWGHSYPEYIAAVAKEAQPKRVLTFHHDPSSNDAEIVRLARIVEEQSGIESIPAYEGLTIACAR